MKSVAGYRTIFSVVFGIFLFLLNSSSYGIFVDGKGHYSLLGSHRTNPGFDSGSGTFEAINYNLLLDTEIRSTDLTSFFVSFRLFNKDPRLNLLGDDAQPPRCSPLVEQGADGSKGVSNRGEADDCQGRHQDSTNPGYQALVPKITEAYVVHATDFCLITAGRRSREWGMGVLLDAGKGPFDTAWSVYDGFTCDINIQKSKTLGFKIGYDKLTETGSSTLGEVNSSITQKEAATTYGASNPSDDLNQLFFTIEYDDSKANAGSSFTKQIGIYFAYIKSNETALKTDVKLVDLYLSFFLQDLILQQEFIFRLGKSAEPSFARLGGTSSSQDNLVTNRVQAIGAAGSLEYILSKSGTVIGPREYNQGNQKSHSLFLEYAFAPGDRDGYQPEYDGSGNKQERQNTDATAMAFHRNYKPALILFNGTPATDELRVDGIYDPGRVMNTSLLGLGYRYKDIVNGNFEAKLLTGKLNKNISEELKSHYSSDNRKPVGYYGRSLGYELDLSYDRKVGKGFEWGLAGAIALPGDAFKGGETGKASTNMLLQFHTSFFF